MSTRSTNTGAVIVGSLMILFGALALLAQVFRNMLDWGVIWPSTIIAAGLAFFIVMIAGGRSTAAFAIPGSILAAIGLILLYQNLSGHWESWSYSWAAIVMSVGIGIAIAGLWGRSRRMQSAGLRVLRVGLILFVVFGTIFELTYFGTSRNTIGSLVFPGLLILVGVYLVLTRAGVIPPIGPRDDLSREGTQDDEVSS